jgi:hypothetical protein
MNKNIIGEKVLQKVGSEVKIRLSSLKKGGGVMRGKGRRLGQADTEDRILPGGNILNFIV